MRLQPIRNKQPGAGSKPAYRPPRDATRLLFQPFASVFMPCDNCICLCRALRASVRRFYYLHVCLCLFVFIVSVRLCAPLNDCQGFKLYTCPHPGVKVKTLTDFCRVPCRATHAHPSHYTTRPPTPAQYSPTLTSPFCALSAMFRPFPFCAIQSGCDVLYLAFRPLHNIFQQLSPPILISAFLRDTVATGTL